MNKHISILNDLRAPLADSFFWVEEMNMRRAARYGRGVRETHRPRNVYVILSTNAFSLRSDSSLLLVILP